MNEVTPTLELRPLTAADQAAIVHWPPYPPEFQLLDYALRPGGWLDLFPASPGNRRYAAWSGGQLVGFTLLVDITAESAEFYIAVHPLRTGQGLGKPMTQLTLGTGFGELGLARIHLKVRTWHHKGIALYERYGFRPGVLTHEKANGELVEFLKMEVTREQWQALR